LAVLSDCQKADNLDAQSVASTASCLAERRADETAGEMAEHWDDRMAAGKAESMAEQ
jgi:hypothetical protein